MDKISIIVPVYNEEHFIKECLDSLINQTYKNIEIIVVNDASTDNTKKVVQQYMKRDKRIVYLENKVNIKQHETLNIGYEHITGDYITICDADDILHPEACQILYDKLLEYDADIVTSYLCGFTKKPAYVTQSFKPDIVWTNTPDSPHEVLLSYFISWKLKCHKTGSLIKNDIIKKFLIFSPRNIAIRMLEDWISSPILYACSNKRVQIDREIYGYRRNPNSSMRRKNKEIILDYFREFPIYYQCNKYFFKTIEVWDIIREKFYRDTAIYVKNRLVILPWYLFDPKELVEFINEWPDNLKNIFIEELFKVYVLEQNNRHVENNKNKWTRFGAMTSKQKIKHAIKFILRKLGLKRLYEKH